MAVQKRVLLLSAAALSFLSFRYVPQLAIFPASFFWNVATIFLFEVIAQLAWTIVVYPLFLSPLRHLPQPPDASLVLGHFKRIFKEPTGEPQRDWIDNVENDGVIYYRWLFNESRVLVTTPKALAEVLVQRNYEFVKPQRIRQGLGRLLGVGILLAEGDEHKRQRRALMPAFSFRHVKDLYPTFWDKSREMVKKMADGIKPEDNGTSIVEIRDWASRATLDIIGVAGMGQDFNAIDNPENELNTTYKTIFSPGRGAQILQLVATLLPQWFLMLLPLKRNEEMKAALGTIKRVAGDLIREKRAKMEKGGRSELDILSVALESGGFSDDELVNQLMTFLAAGHETTASAMTWATYLLCKHPEVQRKLRAEIRASLPSITSSDPITSTTIDKLPYLNAVLNETMRVFPPVPLTLRETLSDTTIQGSFIPAGTSIIICPWAINTSKALWGDDARDFNPDRWLGQGRANTGGADSNYAITTFLHGPRSCIGKDFAKAEFACLVAAMIGRFEIELEDPGRKLEIQGGITAKPKGGLNVRLTEVEGW
ncbi:cytochrome P450 [Aaosphaeria arxii CBS 175.79]|uniref:Cytochrome P450 n=1 Tax=Aaosphaeria arxii CBS 175.79 TaxID=1450172 RepID=A0A6A5XA14_9PLEO|nr:cytochrome P450 [Aaosphaeria arxii CBS 175.79]KAF2009604.1 cytochrome P450 [Aaosphaeria arxii CBS 175.79]